MVPIENREEFAKLADDLEKENPIRYAEVIVNLRNLEYDDFENEKFATPKLQMITDFTDLGREDIVERIKNGDFDQ